jgi:hypothetical protein
VSDETELDAARRRLAQAAVGRILGGVAELCEMGAVMPGPIADAFSKIGERLHAGDDPMEVAVVCFALATALRNPEDTAEIQRSAEEIIRGMQSEKSEGT